MAFEKKTIDLPSQKLTFLSLKMDGWKMIRLPLGAFTVSPIFRCKLWGPSWIFLKLKPIGFSRSVDYQMNENQPTKRLGKYSEWVGSARKNDMLNLEYLKLRDIFAMNTFFSRMIFRGGSCMLPMESPQQPAQRNERKTRGLWVGDVSLLGNL